MTKIILLNIFPILISCNLALAQDGVSSASVAVDHNRLREDMVSQQIEARGITDRRLLGIMRKVERHKFVPENLQYFAYEDRPLPIGSGQTISQPYIVAIMTELLELEGNEKVLEIGTGSGYQAAVLAGLAEDVYTIEILPELASRAEDLLTELGLTNIKIKVGDGYLGWPEFAPFDAIIVTCAPDTIPDELIKQLADGGKMVIPVGSSFQQLKLLIKDKGRLIERNIFPVKFVPMIKQDRAS